MSVLVMCLSHVCAQTPVRAFPAKVVTLVVPFTPSSGSDIIARTVAPKLAALWGQAVVVDNRAGASGNIGGQFVATAPADGHTLLMAINTFTMTPAIYKDMPFDPVADFAPVAKLAEAGFALALHPGVPAKDMNALVLLAKAKGSSLTYASPGNGTPQHLAMELLKSSQGLDILHVPYKGIQGALTDLVGGQVQMLFGTIHSLKPLADAGKVKEIAVTGAARSPLAPDVMTFREQGMGFMDSVDAWFAVFAPGKTPADLVQRLNKDFLDVMANPDVKAALLKQGLSVKTSTPEHLAAIVKADLIRWQKVTTDAGIKAN